MDNHPLIEVKKIINNGWKQGSCAFINKKSNGFGDLFEKEGIYIVISHDCDLLNSSLEKEPVVEFIYAEEQDKLSYKLNAGKNPRQLHIKTETNNGGKKILNIYPYNKISISRKHLETLVADDFMVAGRELKILLRWLAKRYIRAGFPDSFNCRINKKTQEQISIILETDKSQGLFIRLHTDKELPKTENYNLLIKMLVDEKHYNNVTELVKIEKDFEKIVILPAHNEGITVVEGSQVISKEDISLSEYQKLQQWDYDDLSFLNEENGEVMDLA